MNSLPWWTLQSSRLSSFQFPLIHSTFCASIRLLEKPKLSAKISDMWSSRLWLSIALLAVFSQVQALEVTPGSECEALCLDGSNSTLSGTDLSSTNASDITCRDREYFSTGTGIRFRNCVTCLQRSKATWKTESDVFWFLCKSTQVATSKTLRDILTTTVQTTSVMLLTCVCTPSLTLEPVASSIHHAISTELVLPSKTL